MVEPVVPLPTRWTRILALVVYGRMNPRGSYWLARTLYTLRMVVTVYSTGRCLYPKVSDWMCQLSPRVDSGVSVLSWVNQSSRLSDLASLGRWFTTLGALLAHWRSSNLPEARRARSLSTSCLASNYDGRLWRQLST